MKHLSLVAILVLLTGITYATNGDEKIASKEQQLTTPIFNVNLPSSFDKSNKMDLNITEQDKLNHFQNCWFFDGLIGGHEHWHHGWHDYHSPAFSTGARIGRKWYLTAARAWKGGIQATFVRVGFSFSPPMGTPNNLTTSLNMHFAPSLGFINAIRFDEKYGLEFNANLGFNLLVSVVGHSEGDYREDATIVRPGLMVNPSVKFRIRRFAIGLDAAIIHSAPGTYRVVDSNGNTWYNTVGASTLPIISLTLGTVF